MMAVVGGVTLEASGDRHRSRRSGSSATSFDRVLSDDTCTRPDAMKKAELVCDVTPELPLIKVHVATKSGYSA